MVAQAAKKEPGSENMILRQMVFGGGGSVLFWLFVRHAGASGAARLLALGAFGVLAAFILWNILKRHYATCCCGVAYLAAVEPAFRGYAKGLPYLSAEYLFILVAGLAVLQRRAPLRLPTLLLSLYVLLELSGAGVTAKGDEGRWMMVMTTARLSLFLLIQRAYLTPTEMLRVLASYVAGTLAMAAMGLQGAFTAGEQWTAQSNSEAAGGLGPNQVAGLLALGAFTALFFADLERRPWARLLYLGLAGGQVLSAVLTFTRGGSVILAIGLVLYVSILLACHRVSVAVIGMAVIGGVVALIAIQVTNQMVIERFRDTEMSGREGIWSLGLRIFWEHPAFGVGTGNFYEASEGHLAAYHGRVGTHNEIIRALSEHGLIGASIWFAFIFSCLGYCWSEKRGLARAVSVSWLLMAVAFECHSGLKLSMSMLFMALVVEGFPCRYAGTASTVDERIRRRRDRWTRQRLVRQMADG